MQQKLFYLTFCFLVIFACATPVTEYGFNDKKAKICGKRSAQFQDIIRTGREPELYEWPWLVAIFDTTPTEDVGLLFICEGTLISRNLVLTGAHCVIEDNITEKHEEIVVYLGRNNLLNWGDFDHSVAKEVKKIIVHDDYDSINDLKGDIAILVLKKTAAFSPNIQPICVPNIEDLLPNNNLFLNGTVVGWVYDKIRKSYTINPFTAKYTLYQNEICLKMLKNISSKDLDTVMCVDHKNTDEASTSGYYVQKTSPNGEKLYFVFGILAQLLTCKENKKCNQSSLSLVTNVLHYSKWITSHIDAESVMITFEKEDKIAKEKLDKNLKQCCKEMHHNRVKINEYVDIMERKENQIKKLKTAKENILKAANNKLDSATNLTISKNYERALSLYKDVTEIRKVCLGEDHEETLNVMFETAFVFAKLNRNNESFVLYSEVYEKRVATLGKNHKDTLQALKNKDDILVKL